MRVFKDVTGHSWEIKLTVGKLLAVKQNMGLNLLDHPDQIPDDIPTLMDLLWFTCLDEAKALGLRITAHAQGGHDAAGPRNGDAAKARLPHRANHKGARVADGWRARVADAGHPLAPRQTLDHRLCSLAFIVFVQGQQRAPDAQGLQQLAPHAGVFAGHRIHPLQGVHRPEGDVGQVADRRGHHIQ